MRQPPAPLPPGPVRRPPASAIRGAEGSGGGDVVSLALGDPALPLPAAARRALAEVEVCPYGPHGGSQALRRAVAAYEGVSPDRVLVTCGAQAALFALTQAFLGPGDAALVPDPGFPAYRSLTELAGARAVPYPLRPAAGFRPDAEELAAVLEATDGAKVVFLNHPANPTGAGISGRALGRLAQACSRRGVLLVADEVYRELQLGQCAPGRRSPGLRSVTGDGLSVGSLSKAWAAPGLRVGWLVGDPALLDPCRTLHASMVTSAPVPSQAAARALLEARGEVLPAVRRVLERRWRQVAAVWKRAGGREWQPPDGGIFQWLPVGGDDRLFCRLARRMAGVALVPGSAFGAGGKGWVRLCFASESETLRRGVGRLAAWWGEP